MKAYILRHDSPKSHAYSETASQSCERLGVEWEYFDGYSGITKWDAFCRAGYPIEKYKERMIKSGRFEKVTSTGCNMANHAAVWKKIVEGTHEKAIIFEHDSILLHKIDIDIPDGVIVALGYRIRKPERYNHEKAGPPKKVVKIIKHVGSHAYIITKKTAQMLIDEIYENDGPFSNMDQCYFLRGVKIKTKIPLAIVDPIAAVAWVRESTISKNAKDWNTSVIQSFNKNFI